MKPSTPGTAREAMDPTAASSSAHPAASARTSWTSFLFRPRPSCRLKSFRPFHSGGRCDAVTMTEPHASPSPSHRNHGTAATIIRQTDRIIREDACTNHSSPLASTRAAGSQQSPPVWRRPPTARLAAPTHQNHGTAARISRQTDRTIREDASTNHSSPLASTRAVASLPFTLMSCPPAAR